MIRRLVVHTAAALTVMLAASLVAAVLLPADAEFLMHVSGRTGGRLEGLLLTPMATVLIAGGLAVGLRSRGRPPAEWPLQLALVHLLALLHLNVVASGFQRSATGPWEGWIATVIVLAVAIGTVLAAVRALRGADAERNDRRMRGPTRP